MNKFKTTILLAALAATVFSNCGALVFCQGDDGHAAIESALHNHCPSDAEHGSEHGHNDGAVHLAATHDHCKDTMLTTNIVVFKQKNTSDMNEVLAINVCQYQVSSSTNTEPGGRYCWNIESTPFFTPLRTIVLLA
jgi:hypothetical protein